MGTSQSHTLKSGPNWSEAKLAITCIARGSGNVENHCRSFISHFSSAIGNTIYRGREKQGEGVRFGAAGARVSQKFVSFIQTVKSGGLSKALNDDTLSRDQQPEPKDYIISKILKHISGEHESTMDDAAAIAAMDRLLNEILSDCSTENEIEARIRDSTNDDQINWLIIFEVEYILEFSGELFQSHIFDKCDNPENTMDQIRKWLHKELDEWLRNKLNSYDMSSAEGKAQLETLTAEILEIWKQE